LTCAEAQLKSLYEQDDVKSAAISLAQLQKLRFDEHPATSKYEKRMFELFSQITWIDYVGSFGTLMVVTAYFLTQMRYMSATDLAFPVINLIGSLLIGASLYVNFNLASALIEFFWIIISIIGIFQWFRFRNQRTS